MTRKHFTAAAEIIRDMREGGIYTAEECDAAQAAMLLLCGQFSNRDINGNRLFDRDRFIAACQARTAKTGN